METLLQSFAARCFASGDEKFRLNFECSDGGRWSVDCVRQELNPSLLPNPDLTIKATKEQLQELLRGTANPQQSLLSNSISIEGSRAVALEISPYFLPEMAS